LTKEKNVVITNRENIFFTVWKNVWPQQIYNKKSNC